MSGWTFLTNHTHVLRMIYDNPDVRMRDIAQRVEITERAVQRIVHDLVEEGYLEVVREGRRNHYAISLDAPLRHPLDAGSSIQELLDGLAVSER